MIRMLGHFQVLLQEIAADPQRAIDDYKLLSAEEEQQLLQVWSRTTPDAWPDACVHSLFEAQVERTPLATAVVFEQERYTYREINRRANQLAHHLQRLGVGPEAIAGIRLERSPNMVVAMLGVMKAGGAYMPIDPAYPPERTAFMLADAHPQVLLTQASLLANFEQQMAQAGVAYRPASIIDLDADWPEISRASPLNPSTPVQPDSLAYVIYTSGSTGRPKGVLLQHRGLVNLVQAQIEAFAIHAQSQVLQFASFSFDASVSEVFVTLAAGATLHLARRETLVSERTLAGVLQERGITAVTLPPTLLKALSPAHLPRLQTVVSAGEQCSSEVAERWGPKPGISRRFVNAYGPTEATVGPMRYVLSERPVGGSSVPIGRPIANTQVYLLDAQMRPAPVGIPGELYVGGVGVGRGYLGQPGLTADRFVPDPFSTRPGARLYRTGDLGRYLHDGNIEFLGRSDHQIKLRGTR